MFHSLFSEAISGNPSTVIGVMDCSAHHCLLSIEFTALHNDIKELAAMQHCLQLSSPILTSYALTYTIFGE